MAHWSTPSLSQRDAIDDERKASSAFLDDVLSGPAGRDKAFIPRSSSARPACCRTSPAQAQTAAGPPAADAPGHGQRRGRQQQRLNSGSSNGGNNCGNNGGNNSGNNGPYGRNGGNNGGNNGCNNVPVVGATHHGGTTLYDALFLASDELMSKQKGRKAVIILSDGDDRGSKESLASAIEAAQRADTIVYAIYFKGRGAAAGGGGGRGGGNRQPESSNDGKKTLQRIADQTGGRLFEMDKKNSLADIYKQIGSELRAQYRLGYTPDKDAASDGYHHIQVSLKGDPKDLFTQARDGYYTGPPD